MKKITAILLVLVLLFMTSATTLAEDPVAGTGNPEPIRGNSGETKVTVGVSTANLSVTVPVSMTIVAPVAGGTCTVPSNYAIVNMSALAVKVTGIQVTDAADGLIFSDREPAATVADKNKVSIKLTPDGGTAVQLTTAQITSGLGGFDINAAADAAGTSKAIAIAAKSGMLSSTDTSTDAFTITFTVAAGTTE